MNLPLLLFATIFVLGTLSVVAFNIQHHSCRGICRTGSPFIRSRRTCCLPFLEDGGAWSTRLLAAPEAGLSQRLGLDDRFDRWRYMQRLLDEETSIEDTNELLFAVLNGYLKLPRPAGSPELTRELRRQIEELLANSYASKSINVVTAADDEIEISLFEALEAILPDQYEDEDSHKSMWDTMNDLYGREAVKINEREGRPEWRSRCIATRLLIHYDFLTAGVVDVPIQ